MDPFEYSKAFASLWTLGGKAFMTGQENAYRAFSEMMAKMASQPGMGFLSNLTSDSGEAERASQAASALWQSAIELSATLAQRLPKDEPGADAGVNATFRKMLDPRVWMSGTGELDEMLQRMAEGPRLADMWDIERKYTRVFQAWLTLRRNSLEHSTTVLDAWVLAARSFSEQMSALAKDSKEVSAKEALGLWVDTANRIMLETQKSETFLKTQAQMLKASTDLRFAQRELTEYYGGMFGFPTRTELDDVHRTVTELKRELRIAQRVGRPSRKPRTTNATEKVADRLPNKAIEAETPSMVAVTRQQLSKATDIDPTSAANAEGDPGALKRSPRKARV